MFTHSLSDRMKLLIEAKLPKYGRFQELEKLTKIKNATWQTWARGRQRPTDRMIEAVACIWPEHAYWLVTGDELPKEGMTNPTKTYSRDIKTLEEFTGRTLGLRLAIREELTAYLSGLGTQDPSHSLTDTEIKDLADKFVDHVSPQIAAMSSTPFAENESPGDRYRRIVDEATQDLEKIAGPESWNERWSKLMAEDTQLQELEQTRNRLVAQLLRRESLQTGEGASTNGN